MGMDVKIPDVDVLKRIDGMEFVRVVCAAMGRYDMQSPGFNLAANAKFITPLDPTNRALFLYPAEAQDLIAAGLKALREFDTTGQVSPVTREGFIIAEAKDQLRIVEGDKTSSEYRDLCARVMGHVTSRLTTLGSLALEGSAEDVAAAAPKKPAPKAVP